MGKPIITISRQYGAGGGELGRQLESLLNIPLYNKQIITEVASQYGINENYVKMMNEIVDPVMENQLLISMPANSQKVFDEDNVFDVKTFYDLQRETIKKIASNGPCIIVGRQADAALRGHFEIISIFIYAGETFRINRMMKKYGYSRYKTSKLLKRTDANRDNYCKYYTGRNRLDFSNYDYSFNSEKIELCKIAQYIASVYRKLTSEETG